METLSGIPYPDLELDVSMASEISSLFGTQDDWAPWNTNDVSNLVKTNYLGFNIPSSTSDDRIALASDIEHPRPAAHELETAVEPPFKGFRHTQAVSQALRTQGRRRPVPHPSRPASAMTNTTAAIPHHTSPLQTDFDCSAPPLEPFPSLSTDRGSQSPISSKSAFSINPISEISSSSKRNRASIKAESDSEQLPRMKPPPIRRRKSEHVEPDPGSARAIYLEKNRKAASKCRNKQKQQQEELVQTARDVERMNKTLKAQVAFLKDDLSDLMEIVGQHGHCPDNRLRTYVQREADRLAGAGSKSPFLGEDPLGQAWPPEIE